MNTGAPITRRPRRRRPRAFCERCGFEPQNRSQALWHAATCGSIVRKRVCRCCGQDMP